MYLFCIKISDFVLKIEYLVLISYLALNVKMYKDYYNHIKSCEKTNILIYNT
jgi:hypothetical protein